MLKAVEAGEIGFAVDQQAYLQGYLPIEMLALRARYGILPAQRDVVATGPNFVTRGERRAGAGAERAVDSLGAAAGAGAFISPPGARRLDHREAAADARRRAAAIAQRVPHAAVVERERARAGGGDGEQTGAISTA